jgi:hypothetical protein
MTWEHFQQIPSAYFNQMEYSHLLFFSKDVMGSATIFMNSVLKVGSEEINGLLPYA